MSITDELREWGNRWEDTIALEIKEIADRIDERYHRDMATAQQVGINEGEDAAMREGWVELPKDADGEYIHVGERVQLIGNDPGTVSHMSLADDGWRVYVKYDGGIGTGSGEPKHIRHYHAPTVEDVLREFADHWNDPAHYAKGELVEQYAAKLRLAKEDA